MEPMVLNRRNSAPLGDQEATTSHLDGEYRTALGQGCRAGAQAEVPLATQQGEASPNTLEQGGATGPP